MEYECPDCEKDIEQDVNYCPRCGFVIEVCVRCGTIIENEPRALEPLILDEREWFICKQCENSLKTDFLGIK